MAKAAVCDICGKFFIPNKITMEDREFFIFGWSEEEHADQKIDICEQCYNSFLEWVLERKDKK